MSRGLDIQAARLGIDVGGTNIKWVVLDGGTIADAGSVPTARDGEQAVTAQLAALIGERSAAVRGIGVTVPGHVDEATGRTGIVPNLPGRWRGFPLRDTLARATGRHVALLNDARAFALAELHLGAATELSDVLFVALGTGVGGAVVLDRVLLGGAAGRIGEVGHIGVLPDGPACGCGNRGCVDAIAGGAGLVAAARASGVRAGNSSGASDRDRNGNGNGDRDGNGDGDRDRDGDGDGAHGVGGLTPADVFAEAARGDPAAVAVVERARDAVAYGVTSACALLGISAVVLGGGLARLYPGLAGAVARRLALVAPLIGPAQVRLAHFTDRSAAIGAALGARNAPPDPHPRLEHP